MQNLLIVLSCSKGDDGNNSSLDVYSIFEKAEEKYKEIVKGAMSCVGIDHAVEMWSIPTMVGFRVDIVNDTVIDIYTPHGQENQVYTWNTYGQRDELGTTI